MLEYYELILVPIYWILLTKISMGILKRRGETEIKLAKRSLHLKFIGAIVGTTLFNIYYPGGDTTAYYNDGRLLNSIFLHDPVIGLKMFFTGGDPDTWSESLRPIIENFRFAIPANTWLVCKFAAFLEFFCFRSMLVTTMLFANISFFCLWRFYKKINEIFPQIKKYSPWAIFYVPSLVLWGSGILKDTICISALSLLFVSIHQILFKKEKVLKWLIIGLYSGYLLAVIKSYILLSFGGSIMIWVLFSLVEKNKNVFAQLFAKALISIGILAIFAIGISQVGADIIKTEVEDVLIESTMTGKYLKWVAEKNDGSAYDIGNVDATISSFVSTMPAALNVTFFRPYLWESRKPIMLFSALESTAVFILFLYVLFKARIYRFFSMVIRNSFITFCFVYCVIFGTFVGISSFNFGTLVRYKIPCFPFFLLMLFLILAECKKKKLPTSELVQ
ncbi:hypothetical protein ACQ33O_02325 [Ferruginibacter sp. SUN002]|uniref:hypothetical protein n=1 Tax=Ferruginibacter sp. SUN002 TaxID=2937789 RepID=UPI003D35E6A7